MGAVAAPLLLSVWLASGSRLDEIGAPFDLRISPLYCHFRRTSDARACSPTPSGAATPAAMSTAMSAADGPRQQRVGVCVVEWEGSLSSGERSLNRATGAV
jgi:hypothetical protein